MSGFSQAFLGLTGSSSFTEFCAQVSPEVLAVYHGGEVSDLAPHGTTVVAATFDGGALMVGDRRATRMNMIAQRDIEKVFAADESSLIGVAGTAGLAMNLARQFQVELEHYAKIEGAPLSLPGKANRLASMLGGNLKLAMQGLSVVPIFAGWDATTNVGRVFSFDATGGCYEEKSVAAVGSGAVFAKGALKKLYWAGMPERDCALAMLQALFDAADDDAATGGPDVAREIYPVLMVATSQGVRRYPDVEVADLTRLVLQGRATRPNGPQAGVL